MNNILFTFLIIILIIFLNKLSIKNQILLSNMGDKHQKFISKLKIPLVGGIVLFFSIIFLQFDINLKILTFLFFILGLISDLKIISSANQRFLIQFLLIVFCVLLLGLEISNTRVQILDYYLENNIFNIFFVSFCIIVIVNGSNFIDGVNLNTLIYYFLINFILYILANDYNLLLSQEGFLFLGISLVVISIFNFKNKLFLGDNGTYLLGFFYSVVLIDFYESNQTISPFFIILLLWYPAFENLFSILRKFIIGKSPLKPDNLHFHHLIYLYLNKKIETKNIKINTTGIVINLFNLIIFSLGMKDLHHSQSQIILIILSVIVYFTIYLKLYNKKLI